MPNILVIGATGYIGRAVASQLVRSGSHTVYGLARSAEKARVLTSLEIIPVEGSIHEPAKYLELVRSAPIDIVVDVAAAYGDAKLVLEDLKKVGKERIDRATAAGVRTPKLGLIYCSGIWVHGDAGGAPVTDLCSVGAPFSLGKPPTIVAWRPAHEQEVITATEFLDTMVIRPSAVYGRDDTLWGAVYGPIVDAIAKGEKEVSIAIEPKAKSPLVHVDDVATGFQCAVEKLPLIAGTSVYPIFDLVTSFESVQDIAEAAAKALGFKGAIRLVGAGDNLFMQAVSTTVNPSSSRAIQILGWQPKRFGYVKSMETIARAWLAAQPAQ